MAPAPWLRAEAAARERQERPGGEESGVLVEGHVVDHESGDPLAGATVSLHAGPAGTQGPGTRVTDDDGRFRFEDVPAGTYRVSVSSQGYRAMDDTLRVSADGDLEVILPLSTDDTPVEPIIVQSERSPGGMRGYASRRRTGSGFLVTRQEILDRRPRYLTELLHRVPGGMIVPTPPQGYTLLLRNQCRPGIFMDGVPIPGATGIDRLVSPMDVQAVEVYHGFELPVEFGVDTCGGVLVWTRAGTAPSAGAREDNESGVLGSVVRAAALIAIVLLVAR